LELIAAGFFIIGLRCTVPTVAIGISSLSSTWPIARRGPRRGLVREGTDDPKIVFGVLEVAFRQDAVTALRSVAREIEIFLMHLIGIAPNSNLGAIAVKCMIAVRSAGASVVVVITAATPPTFVVWTLSHFQPFAFLRYTSKECFFSSVVIRIHGAT
jgi:hypothetical protein